MGLVHERRGSGEPLLLVHGIGEHWQDWEPVLDLLAAEYDVIAVDLPGFGASPPLPPGATYDLDGLTGAVQEFCAELGLDRPHVVGNSLGGLIALELAARGRVRTATAISPAGFWNTPEIAYTTAVLRIGRLLARGTPHSVIARLAGLPVLRTALFGVFFGRVDRHDPVELAEAAATLAHAPAFEPTLRHARRLRYRTAPRVPVTLVWGTRDRLLPPWQAARASRVIEGARGVWLPGCGHVPMGDDPRMVARVIGESVSGRSPTARAPR